MITSASNQKIKLVRNLQNRNRIRQDEGAFVAEGVRLLEEAVDVRWPIKFVFYDETLSERGQHLISRLNDLQGVEIAQIPTGLMAEISDTETPQGILGVLALQALALNPKPTILIIADQIRDPGNLGTLLRTAEAAGADGVLLSPGTVDGFSPKVVRSGMGAHFHLPILSATWHEIKTIVGDIPVYLADSTGGTTLWNADLRSTCALLVGGEAFGASKEGEQIATHRITIPMPGRAESLNAAIAAGILIAEVLRQRST